ncbi:MAG TPA: hypothetical protein VJ063_03400 [Verrucomicrobiae bacterium]|nr:hypothetical protein [Verrucomicrobiae bacterium]
MRSSRRKEAHFKLRTSLPPLLLGFLLSATCLHAATNTPVAAMPVPTSPYLPRIYKFVEALLEDAASRTNLHHHQNFLRVLYTLSELSTKPKYREAADGALRLWLANVPSPNEPIQRPWMLWDRCFQVDRVASERFALAVLKNQIRNHAGFYLRTCAAAYAHTTNAAFLPAIESLVTPFEGCVPLSFAIDCDGSASLLPEPLSSTLRRLADASDVDIHSGASPQTAMIYVSRYENTGRTAFRDAIHSAAKQNLKSSRDLPPISLGHSISLQLAAWRSTARQEHLDKARAFGDFALTKYFTESPKLIPGLDTLALSLVELHLHLLYITAVRYPPNIVDR